VCKSTLGYEDKNATLFNNQPVKKPEKVNVQVNLLGLCVQAQDYFSFPCKQIFIF